MGRECYIPRVVTERFECGMRRMYVMSLYHYAMLLMLGQGKTLHILKDHAHWVTTLALNTDFVLRTGPFDHRGITPSSDAEGICVVSTFI